MIKILNIIKEAKYILLLTHKNPDADTISSACAFSLYLDTIKKKYKLFNIETLPKNLDFLPNYNKFVSILPKQFDLVIYFDTANSDRVGININNSIISICFDHHKSNHSFATYNIINIDAPSTAEIVAEFFLQNDIFISKQMANALLCGIYDDSKGFSLDRVSSKSFDITSQLLKQGGNLNYITTQLYKRNSLAKYRLKTKVLNSLELYFEGKVGIIIVEPIWLEQCGAKIEDADEFVDEVLDLAIVEIAILLRVKNNQMRISFRSKNINIAQIASKIGGGGHQKAAGATINTLSFNTAKIKILDIILQDYIQKYNINDFIIEYKND